MNVHNQMEDLITVLVREIFSDEKGAVNKGYCVCNQCRLDVSCYVLNRVQPRYIISGRGVSHSESAYQERIQEKADLVALIHDGIEQVSGTKRPFFNHQNQDDEGNPTGPFFNFPIIKGRIFNGKTFEPIKDVKVRLQLESELVEMVDPNWQNPCTVHESASGSFYFWPAPIHASAVGEKKAFRFAIDVGIAGYEDLQHFLTVKTISDVGFRDALHTNEGFTTEDIFLFPIE